MPSKADSPEMRGKVQETSEALCQYDVQALKNWEQSLVQGAYETFETLSDGE